MNPLAPLGFTALEAFGFIASLAIFAGCTCYLIYLDRKDR